MNKSIKMENRLIFPQAVRSTDSWYEALLEFIKMLNIRWW
jgi:hypothetical protein